MDSLLTPLPVPGKPNDYKPKINQPAKIGTAETHRQNRMFGTARNSSIRPVWDKSIRKTKITVSQSQPKSICSTKTNDKKSTENVNPGVIKKSDTILTQRVAEKTSKNSSQEKGSSASETKTPSSSSSHVRAKSSHSTPFYTALNCSKCRFDRLETSSYWVGHIKMAESVAKHFLASEFFRLAFESQAEPIRNLRIELKRYLLRHGHLWELKEWREVAASYGLLKVESNTTTSGMASISTSDAS